MVVFVGSTTLSLLPFLSLSLSLSLSLHHRFPSVCDPCVCTVQYLCWPALCSPGRSNYRSHCCPLRAVQSGHASLSRLRGVEVVSWPCWHALYKSTGAVFCAVCWACFRLCPLVSVALACVLQHRQGVRFVSNASAWGPDPRVRQRRGCHLCHCCPAHKRSYVLVSCIRLCHHCTVPVWCSRGMSLCLACVARRYGSQTAQYFNCAGMRLESYLRPMFGERPE